MQSSLLSEYEQQYAALTAELTARLVRVPSLDVVEKASALRMSERGLNDIDELLEQMELAAPSGEREKYAVRIQSYRKDRNHLQKEMTRVFNTDKIMRDELMASEGYSGGFDDQKEKLLQNTEQLQRSSRNLEHGYRTLIETENIGKEVLSNLESQRHVLARARDRLYETETDLGQSSHLLSTMIRRVVQNRALVILIGVFLVMVVIVAIYLTAVK